MTTSTSLNLLALFKTAVSRSGMDTPARAVSGLTPPAKALYVAGAAHAIPRGAVLYVVPSDRDLEETVADVAFFLSALEGLPPEVAERAVLPFPSHEIDPYRGMAPHFGVLSARARALHGLAAGTVRVVVASAPALSPRVSAPDRLRNASIDLKPGLDIAPSDLGELLIDAGFTREDPADERGEFAIRGGILDVYPASGGAPVRLEFLGDTIETLRTYDPATQRSTVAIDQLTVIPLLDRLSDDLSASIFDYLTRSREFRILVSEPEEVHAHLEKHAEQVQRSFEEISGGHVQSRREIETDFFDGDEDDADLESDISIANGVDAVPGPIRLRADATYGKTFAPPAELFVDVETIKSRLESGTALTELGVDDPAPPSLAPSEEQASARPRRSAFGAEAGLRSTHIRCQPTVELHGRIPDWIAELKRLKEAGETSLFVAATPGRAERTIELLKEYDVLAMPIERADDARYATLLVAMGSISRGFRLPDAGLQIYAETDVFDEARRVPEKRRTPSKAFLSDLRDLKVGDLVVHIDHGIGAFVGLKQIGVGDTTQEFLELRYAGDDKLFVPVERLDLVQKYTGATRPPIDRLGGTSWERAKTRVKKAMRDMAEELLKLYAARKAVPGYAFSSDSHWQQEFEDAFEYELTPDQKTAIADIKRDMESPTPMDRLLCGDVGYGKTEVAMRA